MDLLLITPIGGVGDLENQSSGERNGSLFTMALLTFARTRPFVVLSFFIQLSNSHHPFSYRTQIQPVSPSRLSSPFVVQNISLIPSKRAPVTLNLILPILQQQRDLCALLAITLWPLPRHQVIFSNKLTLPTKTLSGIPVISRNPEKRACFQLLHPLPYAV